MPLTEQTFEETRAQDLFGEIAQSYPPEFVAKHFDTETQSFFLKSGTSNGEKTVNPKSASDIEKLPKPEQHALIVLELEMMYGTEYAKSVSERMRKQWDIRDHQVTTLTLKNRGEEVSSLVDVQKDLGKLMLDLYGAARYSREDEKTPSTDSNRNYIRRREIIDDHLDMEALRLKKQLEKSGIASEEDLDYLHKRELYFLESFYDQVSESGFKPSELREFLRSGTLVDRQTLENDRATMVYIFMIDPANQERAFIGIDGMFSLASSGFFVRFSPEYNDSRDLEFSAHTKYVDKDTQANGDQILGIIRDRKQYWKGSF